MSKQLSLFPNEVLKHYDRMLPQPPQPSYSRERKQIHVEEKKVEDLKNLEEEVLSEYIDLRVDVENTYDWLKEAKQYVNASSQTKKDFLKKTHPKFRGQGKVTQDISNYRDEKVFGLFNGLINSYERSYKNKLNELDDFREKNDVLLSKYLNV